MERFRRRLQLLSQGRLVEAQSLVVGTSAAAKKTGGQGRGGWFGAAKRVACASVLLVGHTPFQTATWPLHWGEGWARQGRAGPPGRWRIPAAGGSRQSTPAPSPPSRLQAGI